jgi:hypothetical protein
MPIGGAYKSMNIESITREIHKIHVIADLLSLHPEEETAYIGVLISDITHPLLQKLEATPPESDSDQS